MKFTAILGLLLICLAICSNWMNVDILNEMLFPAEDSPETSVDIKKTINSPTSRITETTVFFTGGYRHEKVHFCQKVIPLAMLWSGFLLVSYSIIRFSVITRKAQT